MTTTSLRLKTSIDPETRAILSDAHTACSARGIEFVLIGAKARDLILHHVYGAPVQRATLDVDIALMVSATDARVAKACSESRESECMRVTVKEYGGLMGRIGGGTLGSIAGGAVDARYGQVLCGVVGVHPAGRLVCGAAVIGSGAYFGGATGGDFLGGVAERVYLQVQDDDKRVDNADD